MNFIIDSSSWSQLSIPALGQVEIPRSCECCSRNSSTQTQPIGANSRDMHCEKMVLNEHFDQFQYESFNTDTEQDSKNHNKDLLINEQLSHNTLIPKLYHSNPKKRLSDLKSDSRKDQCQNSTLTKCHQLRCKIQPR